MLPSSSPFSLPFSESEAWTLQGFSRFAFLLIVWPCPPDLVASVKGILDRPLRTVIFGKICSPLEIHWRLYVGCWPFGPHFVEFDK